MKMMYAIKLSKYPLSEKECYDILYLKVKNPNAVMMVYHLKSFGQSQLPVVLYLAYYLGKRAAFTDIIWLTNIN